MSSFTSLTVNKNHTRFTPKVRQRERRRSSLKHIYDGAVHHNEIESGSSIATATSPATVSASSLSPPPVPRSPVSPPSPTSTTSFSTTAKEGTVDPMWKSPKSTQPSSKVIPSTSFDIPSKGGHIAAVTIPPPSPSRQQQHHNNQPSASAAALPVLSASPPRPSVSKSLPSSTATTSGSATEQTVDATFSQLPRKKRRTDTNSTRSKKLHLEQALVTLDDISHDPAPPDLMHRPLSYFMSDLENGIVSRSYKRVQRKKAPVSSLPTVKATLGQEGVIHPHGDLNMNDSVEASNLQESSSAPQVRLINGEIVLDTSSLYIDKPLGQQQKLAYEVVEEDEMSRRVNSHTHGKQQDRHGRRWSKDEKDQFYQGLTQYGTDFEMIATLLPGRTRREIKNMFNRQEKESPWKITNCILHRSQHIPSNEIEHDAHNQNNIVAK